MSGYDIQFGNENRNLYTGNDTQTGRSTATIWLHRPTHTYIAIRIY